MGGKGAIGSALNNLAELLKKERICTSTKPLADAVKELSTKGDGNNVWGYSLQKLEFNIKDIPRGTMPNNVSTLKIILNVEIHEKSQQEKDIENPIIISSKNGLKRSYSFSVEISALSEGKKVLSHWHLDFDSSNNNEYVHPDFHLTFGGNAMKDEGEDENKAFGKVLILPSPRVSHPPMDAILGIDFIIRNFIKKDVAQKIISNSQYRNAVKASQMRLWRPYILATANYWCKFTCSRYNDSSGLASQFFPSLIN